MSFAYAIQEEMGTASAPHTAGASVMRLCGSNVRPLPLESREPALESAPSRRQARATGLSREAIFNLVRSYVVANMGRRLDMREIVAVTGASHSTVQRIVTAETGTQLSQFILNMKLDQAHAWLSTDRESRSIGQIAAALGYASAPAFSRSYRRRFGEAMSQTRCRAVSGEDNS